MPNRRNTGNTHFILTALALSFALSGCRLKSAAAESSRPDPSPAQAGVSGNAPSASTPSSSGKYGAFQDIFTVVAKKVIPSVVSVSMERTVTQSPGLFGFTDPDDPFGFFFGEPGQNPHGRRRQAPRKFKQTGLGSGFLTDAEGYILTNNHVVEDAQKITVKLSDERVFEAEVVGTDKPSDLAVLKIKGKVPAGLVPLPLGDSDKLQIGEWVVAVGAPYGLYETVTTGIISAKGRENTGISTYGNFLQTDAAINPGNSGGPLVNLDGEAIGINTAIYSQTGGYQGIGFAIPVNLAKHVMVDLIKHGKVTRGWLGVSIQQLSPDMADALGMKDHHGALVGDVVPGGPAEQAGVRRGDVILKLQGQDILDANDLMNRIALIPPGTTIDLTLFRDGKTTTAKAKVTKREEEKLSQENQPSQEPGETESNGVVTSLGLEAADLSDEVRKQLQLSDKVKSGVAVTKIDPDGGAAEAGIEEGDVILEVNRKKVESVKDLQSQVLKSKKGSSLLFLINRKGSTFFALVKPHSPS